MPDSPIDTPSVPTALGELLDLLRDRLAPPSELLDREALARLLNLGVSTLDRLREAGEIGPRPIRLGGAVKWHREEVLLWLRHRDRAGELYDVKTWPAVADSLRCRAEK